ncbi:MAG: cell division protein FtsQ/DivIB [Planctomycetota bacterium]|jgi:hypothetical protein
MVARNPRLHEASETADSPRSLWILRTSILVAFVLTLWLVGPKSWAVLAASMDRPADAGPQVKLERVGLVHAPEWLRASILRNLLTDLEPRLRGQIPIMDEEKALQLKAGLEDSSWVISADLRRVFPDRYQVDFLLRRPVLAVQMESKLLGFVDSQAVVMPPLVDIVDLPRTTLHHATARIRHLDWSYGDVFPDPRVQAAAKVAVEWREHLAPSFPSLPPLREVDASNLGGGFVADLKYSEVLVGLDNGESELVSLHYGRAASDGGRVSVEAKAEVLGKILAAHPELSGLRAADLRLRKTWRDRLSYR